MPNAPQDPLRKVAILVASLDEPWAGRVLENLPAGTAEAVAQTALELGPLDRAEQHEVVREFRRSMANELVPRPAPTAVATTNVSSATGGVELDASLLARLDAQDNDTNQAAVAASPSRLPASPPDAIRDANPESLANLLAAEHPQTIAIVLSRFEDGRAAHVLARLSTQLQAEVLSRLAELDTADPQTLQVVEAQLAEWITREQQQKRRMAVGVDLVQRILSDSLPAQRETILARITHLKPELGRRLRHHCVSETTTIHEPESLLATRHTLTAPGQAKPTADPATTHTTTSAGGNTPPPAPPSPVHGETPHRALATDPWTSAVADNPMEELEHADDPTLLTVLSQADRRIAMLALAGASESLLKRILRGMPRRQAKQFRKQLCAIGPTRLRDMLAAQQQLAQQVREMG